MVPTSNYGISLTLQYIDRLEVGGEIPRDKRQPAPPTHRPFFCASSRLGIHSYGPIHKSGQCCISNWNSIPTSSNFAVVQVGNSAIRCQESKPKNTRPKLVVKRRCQLNSAALYIQNRTAPKNVGGFKVFPDYNTTCSPNEC